MEKPYVERFFEILEDAEKFIQGELAPPRESDKDKLNAFLDKLSVKINEGYELFKRMEGKG